MTTPLRNAEPPRAWRCLQRGFALYGEYYLRRHFHAFRISCRNRSIRPLPDGPLLIYSNHPSWWDPLVGLTLCRKFFNGKTAFAPIDREALKRYPFFAHLGFFGVQPVGFAGGKVFLRSAMAILRDPGNLLWLTPEGRFVDVRERPVRFRPGLGHLACRLERAEILPVAVEYPFWESRLPEILVQFGRPISLTETSRRSESPQEWTQELEQMLEQTEDELAADAQARDPDLFSSLWERSGGVGGVYGCWRALRGLFAGLPWRPSRGSRR